MTTSRLPVLLVAACACACAVRADDQTVTLNNKLAFAKVSFGLQVYDDDTAQQYTTSALSSGIRNFFASVLAGNQVGFGRAVAAAVKNKTVTRDEIFVCGSVNTGSGACSGFDDCKSQTATGCATNLQDLALDELDMIMLDYPASDCDSILGQWAAFEDMLAAKKTKSLAVSNFSPDQLDCIVKNKSLTVPAVNQMPYSIGHATDTVVADNAARGGIVVQAYSPLESGSLASDADCEAIGKAHSKSAAQVALRWIIQHNATFTFSADDAAFFKEDLDIFDFELTDAEMKKLDAKAAAETEEETCTRCLIQNCCSNGLKCKADGHDGSCTTCTGKYESPCGDKCCNSGEECNGGSCSIPFLKTS